MQFTRYKEDRLKKKVRKEFAFNIQTKHKNRNKSKTKVFSFICLPSQGIRLFSKEKRERMVKKQNFLHFPHFTFLFSG